MDALSSQIFRLHTQESAWTAPIDSLPVELLIEIFVYCAHAAAITPIILGQICRRWREIINLSPRIFQHIVLDDLLMTSKVSNGIARTFLVRSKNLDFDVDIAISSRDTVRNMRVFFDFWDVDAGKPKLEQLDINVDFEDIDDDFDQSQSDGEESSSSTQVMSGIFKPYTTSLKSNLLFMDITVSRLPLAIPTPLRFVSLFIQDSPSNPFSLTMNIHPIDLLQLLTACPELEFLSFTGTMVEADVRAEDLDKPPPVPYLPRLRSLVLHSTLSTRIILSYIDSPNLKELYLEHLNVDFSGLPSNLQRRCLHPSPSPSPTDSPRLVPSSPDDFPSQFIPAITLHSEADEDEYEDGREDGDSDDECDDFSQSPHSDHATGMGLRSLFRRCDPALRVLEMDYADMRTKDFRWFFERASALEEFRIVASDMADRVVRMLSPWLVPWCDGMRGGWPAEWSQDTDGHRQFVCVAMLPRLKSLELFNCQRLSGDAIVEALRSRVLETDEAVRRGVLSVSSLDDVAIVGCTNFRDQSRNRTWEYIGRAA
ncbi:hypothetical protein EW146_g827 [Bondarzewia mesenterica]|uniref:F-box domain-containing protein n=1 Tax=Bondarzewia mesenterica TaxID=1095465 RepID=A0A4S4M5L8_9AGAM|nr:hypothetical protein EW146_g827 [Bondarzewia mesenterica]